MMNTFEIYKELITTVDEKTAMALTKIFGNVYEDLKNIPTKQDFERLEDVVYRLSLAQLQTEHRLDNLTKRVEELTEAQKKTDEKIKELTEAQIRTEHRLDNLTKKVEELTEAQKKTDEKIKELTEAQIRTEHRLDNLTKKVEELTEAQKKTDEKIKELTEAQKKTDEKIKELTEAQIRTEKTLEKIIGRINTIEERLEGISNSVGYSLENSAYKSLPQLLEPLGIKVVEKIIRKYINGYQVNIFSKAEKDGKEVYIIGECKVRPSTKEIDRFLRIVDNIKDHTGYDELIPIFVAHDYPPEIERHIKENGIIYFWSYEL